MKQKLIVAGIVIGVAVAGCESRFTSTSDASGPRQHEYADPAFKNTGNTDKNAHLPIETTDSGRGNQMNTQTDVVVPVDTAQATQH